MHSPGAPGSIRMKNGNILHPLDVDDVVDMSVLVHGTLRDGELVTVDRRCMRFCHLDGSNGQCFARRAESAKPTSLEGCQ